MTRDRTRSRQLQTEFARQGNPLGWFEALYLEANGNPDAIPWADLEDNPLLVGWLQKSGLDLRQAHALVVGCGLGDDAETLAMRGARVTAFDLSPTAIAWCRRRFPDSTVEYRAANLFDAPADWSRRFQFVLEINTLQALPASMRPGAVTAVAEFVAPGGALLVICRARNDDDPTDGPPWPLVRRELDGFTRAGLVPASFADVMDDSSTPTRRFVASFGRPVTPR